MRFAIIGLILLFAIPVWAAPFLVCDSYPTTIVQPDWFTMSINGNTPIQSTAETLSDGSRRLHYDVGTLTPGQYHFEIKAVKDYGAEGVAESAASPFDYTKPAVVAPGVPSGVRIE